MSASADAHEAIPTSDADRGPSTSREALPALPRGSARPTDPIKTILLATDLAPASAAATHHSIKLAAQLNARLLIVNVLEKRRLSGTGSHPRVDQARAEREDHLTRVVRAARAAGVTAEFLVWGGDPGSSITAAAQAEHADLVVVGTRGRSNAERMLLGSVSDYVVRHADCPILVVRPPAGRDPES